MSPADTQQSACWTPTWIEHATGGRWLCPPADAKRTLAGIGIDSRTIRNGQVFLAVKGENFDGHDYAAQALQAGADIAIVEREIEYDPSQTRGLLLVDNTIDALHRLARAYRAQLRDTGCTVIAVVGSNGKTTTRHLIHTVLASQFKGTQSPKSFNNHLGVPLTVLGARKGDRFLVAEVGTNHPGEIDALGELLTPDAAVVTCIGHEHLQFFGDLKGVAEEEAAIIPHVTPGGTLFIEADAFEWISQAPAFDPARPAVIYRANFDHSDQIMKDAATRQRLRLSGAVTVGLPLLAPHDATNATAAIEVARWMGMRDNQIRAALETVKPMPGRLEVKHFGPVTVIDDTYNANPDSMRAALSVLSAYPVKERGRRVAVLGDMLELGAISKQSHHEVGRATLALLDAGTLDTLILVGPLMTDAFKPFAGSPHANRVTHHPALNDPTLDNIARALHPGDTTLCKASRGLQLERLMPRLRQRFETHEPSTG